MRIQAAEGPRLKPSLPYDARHASEWARRKRLNRHRLCKLHTDGYLWTCVKLLLRNAWSPEQIALRLKQQYPEQIHLQASHETI